MDEYHQGDASFLELAFVPEVPFGSRFSLRLAHLDRDVPYSRGLYFCTAWFLLVGQNQVYPHDDDDSKVSVPRFFMALASLAFAVYMVPGLWELR